RFLPRGCRLPAPGAPHGDRRPGRSRCTHPPGVAMQTVHVPVTLRVNGEDYPLHLEPRRTLLDALRHDLALTGTKKVCDMGDCGACTVQVDGRAMYACLLLAVDCDGREIRTIEGLRHGDELDSVQQAFVQAD